MILNHHISLLMTPHRSKPIISEPVTPVTEMTEKEIANEMNDLKIKKTSLLQQIDDIDTLYIGYREELRRRKELKNRM